MQQTLHEAMQAGVVIHQCWSAGSEVSYFRHDNLKACTVAGLALIRKGLARMQGEEVDKTLPLVYLVEKAATELAPTFILSPGSDRVCGPGFSP